MKNKWIKQNKGFLRALVIIIILLVIGIIWTCNNYYIYNKSIVKITKVNNSFYDEKENNQGEKEKYYIQKITGIVMNKEYKGKNINIENKYSSSKVADNKYSKGDEVFVTIKLNDGNLKGIISGDKRDKYIAMLLSIFIILIISFTRTRGIFTIISLIINIVIFSSFLLIYKENKDVLWLSNIMMIIFAVVSLLLASGFKRKTFAAIISTLISTIITMLIFEITINVSGGADYGFMEYLTDTNNVHNIFMAEILLGGLGAIMDVSISMSSSMQELIDKDPTISSKSLIKSGKELGYDITGTMINVLLFTYLCGCIPIIILKMKNDFSLFTILKLHIPFEIYRFLAGSIGIMISIPIGQYISILLLKRGK